MWKQLIEVVNNVLSLTRRVQKCEADIKDLRQAAVNLGWKVDQLAEVVQRLVFEFQRDRENAERDREIQRLRLENTLLRFERGLPPTSQRGEQSE